MPQIDLHFEEMEKFHIKPFKKAIENNIEMIMVAHLHCTCFDAEIIPSSLSSNVIGYLRKILGFNGIIISDDMVMKGVQDFGSVEACLMGIKAGVDMFIYRDADAKTINTINEIAKIASSEPWLRKRITESNERIQKLKNKYLLY